MKAQGQQVTQGCLDESTLSELRDDLLNNWEILYSNPEYRGPVDRESNRQIYKKHFTQVPLLKNLVDTFETLLPYLSADLVWLLCKSKQGDGFQGWHKDFYMGGQITKTIVSNVGSKVINNEDTARSFDVSFEVDVWKEIEEYALSGFNIEEEHYQDDQKPAAISTKHPSVSPLAVSHKNPSAEPVVIPHQIKATIPPEDGKNDEDIAADNRKPAARLKRRC
jgi:hypothetical protein